MRSNLHTFPVSLERAVLRISNVNSFDSYDLDVVVYVYAGDSPVENHQSHARLFGHIHIEASMFIGIGRC